MDEAVIESHDVSSSDRQGVTSILWEEHGKIVCNTPYIQERGIIDCHLGKLQEEVKSVASRVSCKLQEEVDSVWQGTVQEKSG